MYCNLGTICAVTPHSLTVQEVSSTSFNENCRKSYPKKKVMSEKSLKIVITRDQNLVYFNLKTRGPRVAHLSDIATADMQMLCNIFPILSSQLMKRSSFKQFLILKKNIYDLTVNGAWSFEQTLNHISTVGSMWNLMANGSEESRFYTCKQLSGREI